jgi:hypothetical protein
MATPELAAASPRGSTPARIGAPRPQYIAIAAVGLLAATTIGLLAELFDASLFASSAPHPTLIPSVGAAASIFATNLRVAVLPFTLIALRFHMGRVTRPLGDVVLAAVFAGNAVRVGLALGRWQDRLLPYLPHLPLEYLAIAAAAAAWLDARRHPVNGHTEQLRAAAGYALAAVVVLALSACVEVLLTPRRA